MNIKRKDSSDIKLFLKFTYDANGNTVERVVYTEAWEVITTFEYDILNRVVRTVEKGKVIEYLYDNAGNRFIKKGLETLCYYPSVSSIVKGRLQHSTGVIRTGMFVDLNDQGYVIGQDAPFKEDEFQGTDPNNISNMNYIY